MQPIPFGRWLKRLRAEQDLTQEMLAELVGCADTTVRAFEIGKRRPSREMAERIADVLKVPADQRAEFLRLARQAVEAEPAQADESPPASHAANPRRVVAPDDYLIGREAEINTLSHLLQQEKQRLVTIVGPGGMGKTRLAQQVAAVCSDNFREGAAFVSLAAVADGQNVPTTIADTLGLELKQAVDVRERVLQLLAERQQLLVLDNFEHLLTPTASAQTGAAQAGAIDFLQSLLQRSQGIHLLVTSRERLRIGRERTFELGGLATPKETLSHEPGGELTDAVILFVERAQQVTSHFVLDRENRAAVVRICNLLDGMPLALELAASWVRVLSCAEIADEIQGSLDFLALADRDSSPRHRSMRAVFDQSWSLLSENERQVLAQLAVFRGGCRREAAAAVAGAALPVLASLIDKSLLRKNQRGTSTRYDMHELIRQYAEEQLRLDPARYAATQARHGEYYLSLVTGGADELNTGRMRRVLTELNGEIDNLRLAWDWAVTNRQVAHLLQTGMVVWLYLEIRALLHEGEEIFRRAAQMAQALRHDPAADRPVADLLWAHMTALQAHFVNKQLQPPTALRLIEPALALLQQRDEPAILQQALWVHGAASWFYGSHEAALADYRQALAVVEPLQVPFLLSLQHVFLGIMLYEVGQYPESFHHLTLGVHYGRQFDDPRSLSFALSYLNRSALALGRGAETQGLVDEALAVAGAVDDWFCVMLAYEQQALLRQMQGNLGDAQALLTEAHILAQQIGDGWSRSRILTELGDLALQEGADATARQHYVDAYHLARRQELLAHALGALAGLATCAAAQGEQQMALTLAGCVSEHAHASAPTRQRARQLQESLAAHFTVAELTAIRTRVATTTFDALVSDVIHS